MGSGKRTLLVVIALLAAILPRAQDLKNNAEPRADQVPGNEGKTDEKAEADDNYGDPVWLDEVVVTATVSPLIRLRSSLSGSVVYSGQIHQSVPSSAADIVRNIPGVLSQASGGEGNANITMRGLPQTGGAKLVQLHEDGLPVLEFGDMPFATADTFLRADYNVDRVEVVRGGAAATFASNSPGGVINFITKTGEVSGGNIGFSRGLDFDQNRLDFDYGRPLNDDWRFHVGGFYREGEGPRSVGYTAEKGGQLKGNVTRSFEKGFIRLNFKLLEDRAPVYLPVPVSIAGTNSDPDVDSLPGFDVLNGAMQSRYFRRDVSVDQYGQRVVTDIADGYHSKNQSFGGELEFRPAEGWKIQDKFRIAKTSGLFVGPYPAQVAPASDLATDIGGPGATLRYASGPRAGQPVTDPDALNGNGLAIRTHLFNTELNNLDNISNDLKATRTFDFAGGTTGVTVGYYKSRQTINQDWHWNTYLQDVRGEDSVLLDVVDAGGNVVTQNGLVAYGAPFWGINLTRSLDVDYDTDAPHLAVNWEEGRLNLDASVRYDIASASGSYATAAGTVPFDVNGDGVIEGPEQAVPIVDQNARQPVDYTVRYFSYSMGANYMLTKNLAVFGRIGEGGRANADRLLFGGGVLPDGSVDERVAVNKVRQVEGGLKWQGGRARVLATLFYTTTTFTDQNITSVTERFADRSFEAKGLELQFDYKFQNGFSVYGGLTYAISEVTEDQRDPANVGAEQNPRLTYQYTMAYDQEKFGVGLNFIGVTDSPARGGGISIPGFTQVNAFASFKLNQRLTLSFLGGNIFNTIGLTEVPNNAAGITPTGVNTGRSINGRTLLAVLKYSF